MATAIDMLKGRGSILGLFFFFLFCLNFISASWVYEEAFPPLSSVKGGMLHFKSDNRFSQLQATYFHFESGYRLILSLTGDPLPDKESVNVSVNFGGSSITVDAHVLKGGHKVAIPKELSQKIATALAEGKSVNFSIGTYRGTLTSEGFKEAWRRFSPP